MGRYFILTPAMFMLPYIHFLFNPTLPATKLGMYQNSIVERKMIFGMQAYSKMWRKLGLSQSQNIDTAQSQLVCFH